MSHAALAASFLGFDLVEGYTAIAALVRHVHPHDNLQSTNFTGEVQVAEPTVYGL